MEQVQINKGLIKRVKPLIIKASICQIDPILKEVDKNIERIKNLIQQQKYSKQDKLDLIIFPEMAFTGYNFDTLEEIKPFLEEKQKGKTFKFLQEIATSLNCYVIGGYPEIEFSQNNTEKYFNSCYVIDRSGNMIQNYRKTFLFETDKIWAHPGTGFEAFTLINCEGENFKVGLGICMDICGKQGIDLINSEIKNDKNIQIWAGKNPYEDLDKFQCDFAEHCKKENVDLVLFPTNWEDHEEQRLDLGSVEGLINYFLWRFNSMINNENHLKYNKSWAMLIANRVGAERNAIRNISERFKMENIVFMGSSACVKINPNQIISYSDKKIEEFQNFLLQLD